MIWYDMIWYERVHGNVLAYTHVSSALRWASARLHDQILRIRSFFSHNNKSRIQRNPNNEPEDNFLIYNTLITRSRFYNHKLTQQSIHRRRSKMMWWFVKYHITNNVAGDSVLNEWWMYANGHSDCRFFSGILLTVTAILILFICSYFTLR